MTARNNRDPRDGDGAVARLSDAQRLDWLQLIRSDNIGPRTFLQLVNRYGGAAAALRALPELIAKAGGSRKIRLADRSACEREIEALVRLGGRFVAMGEQDYPPLLRLIDSPPPMISVVGNLPALRLPAVAIVGARNASAAGLVLTERLAGELAAEGYCIVSGLARGVDRQAHAATLKTGTIAVLAGGFEHIYPSEHRGLAEAICEHGALVSEMPLGWQPRGRDFPRRNRIVSGMSYGTIVVEASRRSGSLITARFANEQGREVFAVPGSPLDPRAEGPNELLRQGASLCLSAASVVEALAPMREAGPIRPNLFDDPGADGGQPENLWDETDMFGRPDVPATSAGFELDEEGTGVLTGAPIRAGSGGDDTMHCVQDLLGAAPVSIDELVRLSGLSVAEVKMALLDLELEGLIERHGGDLVSLAR
ncbi:MAG: DNA-processing protein DprA [Beijerinckiaceae bacterium]